MSKLKSSSNDVKLGFSFDMSPEDFDKKLAAELQSMEALTGSFRSLGSSSPPPLEKSQSKRIPYQRPSQEEAFVPSSSSAYAVGKPVPGTTTMLPPKMLRHDDNFKRIHTAKTTVTNVSDPDFDPDFVEQQLNDPTSDVNYNSSGNNVFVLSCNAVTSMPVVPREGADGQKLSTPQLKKQVKERYAEVQSLFAPPMSLTQHDVDVLNITLEAKKYEELYESSVVDPMERINFSHEVTMQKHVERMKKPKVHVPFNATSPLPTFSKSAPSSLSPVRGGKKRMHGHNRIDPFSDTESLGGGGSSYSSPLTKAHYMKAKSPRSPILTVETFAEVADKMKEDIKCLVQDTIRNELLNMRKKQSRGGNVYIEPTTPNSKEGEGNSGRRQQQPQQQQQQQLQQQQQASQKVQSSSRPINTPDMERIIEKKIENKLRQMSEELGALKAGGVKASHGQGKPNAAASGAAMSPVKPPLGNGVSPKAAAPNKGRKLKEEANNNNIAAATGESGSVKFQEQTENIPSYSESPRSQTGRRLSGASVTFSSDGPTPIMSAQSPYNSHYNRNFSITPGGSLIHSFIDENREYAGASLEEYEGAAGAAGVAATGGGGGVYRRRGSGSKDFVSVGTPAGPNIFGTTPAANLARLSSPSFNNETNPPQSPGAALISAENRASSPRATSRQMSAASAAAAGLSPGVSAPASNASSYGNRSRPISQAAIPDHIDAHASEVTIQVVQKTDSPPERRKSSEVNPNLKVKIDGVMLEDSMTGGGGGGRRKKSGVGSEKSSPKTKKKSVELATAGDSNNVSTKAAAAAAAAPARNDIELLLMQKLNEVLMAPVPSDVVQPPVVARSSKRLSIGTQQRQNQSRELVNSALLAGTASATSILTPSASVAAVESKKEPAVAAAIVDNAVVESVAPVPVITVQKPVISDTKNATVAAVINGRPLPTKEVTVPMNEPVVTSVVKESVTVPPAVATEKPASSPRESTEAISAAPAASGSAAPDVVAVPASVESIAEVRDAMKSAAGLGSRAKTSEIMAQYDSEQKKEEDALLYGTGYGNEAIIQILKKFEKNDGVEVDLPGEVNKLSEREREVLDGEYNELTKQIAQLSKIKSKIKKDLKTWVTEFEATQGRPPSTADKLSIEDRFLAYKTVVTEVEEAKRYSNKIADLLRSSK